MARFILVQKLFVKIPCRVYTMIIQSTQTLLYVMFTWRPWFLWDQRFAFIEWFCLLYPVRRIPDHTAFALVGIHKFIWAPECVF